MDSLFLLLLVVLMGAALISGFPVAFALPGSAILSIGLAALSGYIFVGDPSAFFAQDGPVQWLSSGVTNFRSVYWEVERDTLIAIPLFVFMGIMLQRSKIAEDLLVAMAQLFGPVPGGLGISVVFVGALLAATTGIVGATVIAMGMISLPAMMRHNYDKSLATGTICASGTLGQIIPPSIVLIILADQLSNAADVANNMRRSEYKLATGEGMMPGEFDVVSASAGDMFVGAFLPGMVLVGLYMLYILATAILKPGSAPPVPYEGKYDGQFAVRILLALIPPLALIFVVLGSIILGIATVNQAGAIGAIGALIMGSYRLAEGQRNAYAPAVLALTSLVVIAAVLSIVPLNVKNIENSEQATGLVVVSIASIALTIAIFWGIWRAYTIQNTLQEVMLETAKTTSMVFIILLGAAMLTAAFRGFGGEHLVKEFLTGLPGGFWAQFIVVMLVIFVLGFFIDFIEISVVVVPIVAPILLSDPGANITAVWLGVMLGLNLQTSFLTPPFGFALFYLRGVAPPEVRTIHIYKGAIAFIVLQLVGMVIVAYFPPLANYLPNRTYLTSENAPPPINPKIQECIEQQLFPVYLENQSQLDQAVATFAQVDLENVPSNYRKPLEKSLEIVPTIKEQVLAIQQTEAELLEFSKGYADLHYRVRDLEKEIRGHDREIDAFEQGIKRFEQSEGNFASQIAQLKKDIEFHKQEREKLTAQIPAEWKEQRKRFMELAKAEKKARTMYRRSVDEAYQPLLDLSEVLSQTEQLQGLEAPLLQMKGVIETATPDEATERFKAIESQLGEISGTSKIKSPLSKARRLFKKGEPDREKALGYFEESVSTYREELAWRQQALQSVAPGLLAYDDALKPTVGLRLQPRMSLERAKQVSACKSTHNDISLYF